MVKYTKAFERDWSFYLLNLEKFTFSGDIQESILFDEDGVSAKEAFFAWDSQGKTLPTREPQLLSDVKRVKKSINLHLKMWAEGYDDCLVSEEEYLSEFQGAVPAWVTTSLKNLRKKYKGHKC